MADVQKIEIWIRTEKDNKGIKAFETDQVEKNHSSLSSFIILGPYIT